MKKYILHILFILTFVSCEEVIKIDLETASPKLVIDANLYFDTNIPTLNQKIKISKTVAFYAETYDAYTDAQVWIEDALGNRYDFIDNAQNGNYICNNFQMHLNTNYTLYVIADGNTYKAEDTFFNTPSITKIEQKNDGGFFGNSFEFKIWFQDNPNQQNFYQLIDNISGTKEFDVKDDTFSNGNLMNYIVSDDEIKIGESFNITFSETSKSYYEYMEKILSISQGAGNPFASPIGVIRGNIINQTHADNYPLGYFSLHNSINKTITVQ
jgi:hypothetical protein